MKILSKATKYGEMYYEQFGSYEEYCRIVEDREKRNAHSSDKSLENICENSRWVGCSSYDEAKELLINGWDKKLDYLKECVSKEIDLVDDKRITRTFTDIVGFMPIVPNAIMNLPNCMLNMRKDSKKSKVVKFLIAMNRSWRYEPDEIIKKMAKILARIAILEKHGYACRIELFGSFHDGRSTRKTIVCHSVLLKSENQLFDMRRLAFPVVHSAMQRVFGFAWENSLPLRYYDYHFNDLGRSVQYWEKDRRENLLKAINEHGEKIILVGMESNLDDIFGKEVK